MSLRRFLSCFASAWLLGAIALCQSAVPSATPATSPSASPAVTPAQGQPGTAQNGNQTNLPSVRVRSDEVRVVFTVVDKDGRFVKDLSQGDFRILDNNLPPQQVLNFEAQTDLPLRVALLIDASNSIRERFRFEQDAATEFLQDVVRPKSDRAFVLAFDEVYELTQDFTNDLDRLRKGVKSIRPGGGTALWDAVFYASRDKLMKEQNNFPVRRAMVVVSDGDDNQSRVLRQEAIDMAQRAEVIIYTISTSLGGFHNTGDENLKKLAEATGGKAFFPVRLEEVGTAFELVKSELRSQYSLSYRPEDFALNGKFRPIEITASNKKFKVRARKGYYAPRQ